MTSTGRSGLVGVLGGPGLAVDPKPELLPHLEEGHALREHGDEGAGLRIPPLTRVAVLHHEAPEAADLDSLAAREGEGHAVEHRVHHDLGVAPREAGIELQDL